MNGTVKRNSSGFVSGTEKYRAYDECILNVEETHDETCEDVKKEECHTVWDEVIIDLSSLLTLVITYN